VHMIAYAVWGVKERMFCYFQRPRPASSNDLQLAPDPIKRL
jgi:hypothetical protein